MNDEIIEQTNKFSFQIINELANSSTQSVGFVFHKYVVSCFHGFRETDNNIYIKLDGKNIPLKIYFAIPDYDIILFTCNHDKNSHTLECVYDVQKIKDADTLIIEQYDAILCDIINTHVKLYLAPMMPMIICKLKNKIPKEHYFGLSGSPLIINKMVAGMVLSYNCEDENINILPIYIIHKLITNNTSVIYGINPGVQRASIKMKKNTYHGLSISDKYRFYNKSYDKQTKFKRNDIIIGMNGAFINDDWCIHDNIINFSLDVFAFATLHMEYLSVSYVKNNAKQNNLQIYHSTLYPNVIEDFYNIRLSDLEDTLQFKGFTFAELSEEFILNCAKHGKKLCGEIFEDYYLRVNNINKYVILVDCNNQYINDVFIPCVNGYRVRILEKISRFKVIDIKSLHEHLAKIIKGPQKSFQLTFTIDDSAGGTGGAAKEIIKVNL
jgi:hypothetical protein